MLTKELIFFNAFGKKKFPGESKTKTQTDCFQITVSQITDCLSCAGKSANLRGGLKNIVSL